MPTYIYIYMVSPYIYICTYVIPRRMANVGSSGPLVADLGWCEMNEPLRACEQHSVSGGSGGYRGVIYSIRVDGLLSLM